MKTRYHIPLGIALGLVVAAVALALFDRAPLATTDQRALLSDCDGALKQVVIHYVPEAADVVMPTYRDFLGQLPEDVAVTVVCECDADFDDFRNRIGSHVCQVRSVPVGHAITPWSRDRWLALRLPGRHSSTLLVTPRGEEGAEIWPARRGDEMVAADVADRFGPHVSTVASSLNFDGGDFVCDDETAFVTPAVLLRNLQNTVADRDDLMAALRERLNKRVVLFDNAPPHHAGMFMMTIGENSVIVGDPSLARAIIKQHVGDGKLTNLLAKVEPDFSKQTQERFDVVADRCRDEGYRVARIPVVPGGDGRTYLSYVNTILDQRKGGRVVYLPVFEGADCLNDAAANVWRGSGYEVRRVDCTNCFPHFGTLRCLVNVMERGS
jgi:hypothetical protein